MRLLWNFFYDSWLIDKIPDTIRIVFEEHPNGWKINPPELTCYFGANPEYVYGTGMLHHEVFFGDLGFVFIPFIFGRPGFEFIDKFEVSINSSLDWLGNPTGERYIGSCKVDSYVKKFISKAYGVDEFILPSTPSSELIKMGEQNTQSLTIEFDPIFNNETDYRNNIVFPLHNDATMGILHTLYNAYYKKDGIYRPVISLKTAYLTTDDQTALPKNETFFVKTVPGFREGVVFEREYEDGRGVRIAIYRDGVSVTVRDEMHITEVYHPESCNFTVPNPFIIRINYDLSDIRIYSKSKTAVYDLHYGAHPYSKASPYYICGFSETDRPTEAGDIDDCAIYINRDFDVNVIDRYLKMDPLYNYGFITRGTDNVPEVVNGMRFSSPKAIMIPKTPKSKKNANVTIPFETIYLESVTGSGEEAEVVDNDKIGTVSILANAGYKIRSAVGFPIDELDDSRDYCFAIKKITSDTHYPIKIYMKFKMPEFWTKDMLLDFSLKAFPVNKSIYYEYMRFRTGEFL